MSQFEVGSLTQTFKAWGLDSRDATRPCHLCLRDLENEEAGEIALAGFVLNRITVAKWLLQLRGLLTDARQAADVHERLFRQFIRVAVDDRFEAFDRLVELRVDAREAGELLGHHERLAEEAFDLTSARHNEFVFFAQFVDAEDGDDVLQVAVTLQHRLHLAGDGVVTLADDLRV